MVRPDSVAEVARRNHLGAVFYVSITLSLLFVTLGALFPQRLEAGLGSVQAIVVDSVGPAYPIVVTGLLLFVLALAFSPIGRIRLGEPGVQPEFGWWSWLAMLLSAGVGLSFLFWGMAQPLIHLADPPYGAAAAGSDQAARDGIRHSFLFWGIHAWATYAVVAVAVGYFCFRHQRPILISSALRPLIGDHADGALGKLIDVLAVFAILFGVATSLGLGTRELNAGLGHTFGIPETFGAKIAIIAALMTVSTISAMTGLGRGIRVLSLANLMLCAVLLAFVLLTGPTRDILGTLGTGVGDFATHLVPMSLATEGPPGNTWEQEWTYFFWAWWISWAPFVGTFIARISRGRTIRGVVTGVVLVPGAVTLGWFSVFGGTALHRERTGVADLAGLAGDSKAVTTFEVLQTLPLPALTAALLVPVLALLFITSADSASFMLGSTTSGGSRKPPRPLRLMWSFAAAFAAVLLLSGGVAALQGAALVAAVPFTIILVALGPALLVALRRDRAI